MCKTESQAFLKVIKMFIYQWFYLQLESKQNSPQVRGIDTSCGICATNSGSGSETIFQLFVTKWENGVKKNLNRADRNS